MDAVKNGGIRYLRVPNEGIEVVVCENRRLSYPLHNHVSAFVVGVVLSGTVRLTRDRRTTGLSRGLLFVVPPYVPHALESDAPCSLVSVCVDKKTAARAGRRSFRRTTAQILKGIPLAGKSNRRPLACLLEALVSLKKFPPPAPGTQPYIETLRARLESHPEVELSLEAMAQAAHAGKYHLLRSFRREVGLTPHRFQIQNRVRLAQRLLERSASMTEAALAAGFADQSHFIRQFKKVVDMTPTSYLAACGLVEGGDELREEK